MRLIMGGRSHNQTIYDYVDYKTLRRDYVLKDRTKGIYQKVITSTAKIGYLYADGKLYHYYKAQN